jgi:hypothetical protein
MYCFNFALHIYKKNYYLVKNRYIKWVTPRPWRDSVAPEHVVWLTPPPQQLPRARHDDVAP